MYNRLINILKRMSILKYVMDIINSSIIILKYYLGININIQNERADPNDPKWIDDPWANVMRKRSDYAKSNSKDKNVLDLCCGTGWTTYEIAGNAKSVVGIDCSDEAIKIAKKSYNKENITYLKMDALNLQFPSKTFDLVVSMEAIEHFTKENGHRFIKEAYRVLKDEGVFIGSTPNIENRSPIKLLTLKIQDPFHLFLYSSSILKDTLLSVFKTVTIIPQKEEWLLFKSFK